MYESKPIYPAPERAGMAAHGGIHSGLIGQQNMAAGLAQRQPYILAEMEDIGRKTARLEESAVMLGERLGKAMRITPSNPMNQCKRESTSVEMADHLACINERLQSVINDLQDYLDRLEI